MFKVSNIIYIYLFICLALVFFNVWYTLKEKVSNYLNKRGIKKLKEIIKKELINLKYNGFISENHKNKLKKILIITNQLIIYESAIKEIKEEIEIEVKKQQEHPENKEEDIDNKYELNNELLENYLDEIFNVFEYLIYYYSRKDSVHKAYFSSVLMMFNKKELTKGDKIIDNLLSFVHDHSIYCRENALKFIYNNGDYNVLMEALMIIQRNDLYYNFKLLTDDLLSYKGDHEQLISGLINNFDYFNSDMQASFINYMRLAKIDFNKQLYNLYISHKYGLEVELALIRYFSRHYYRPMIDELLSLVNNKSVEALEYRIVACSVLKKYDSQVVRDALINSLSDPNWYVRKNSADSLINMQLTSKDMERIQNIKDKYGKEMYEYTSKMKELGR